MIQDFNDATFTLTAKDGHVRHVYNWNKVEQPRAILQVFHGMAEHAARYARLAEYMNSNGIIVIADDLRGHGKTADLNGKLGVIGKNGFNKIVEDEYELTKMLKLKYTGIPLFIFAHSFGSFIGQDFITRYGSEIDGIILSGSAAQTGFEFKLAKALAWANRLVAGEDKEARLLDKLSFGSYNKGFGAAGDFDWLSRDTAEVKKYADDPKCGFVCSVGFYYYFMDGLLKLYNRKKLDNIPKNLPIYIISGQQDPVGQKGKRVTTLYELYKSLGIKDLQIKLYKSCRHELLNELNRDEVSMDILKWLDKRL